MSIPPIRFANQPPAAPVSPRSAAPPLPWLVAQLGVQTRISMDGQAMFNEPLVQQIVAARQQALPHLQAFLGSVSSIPGILEGLYLAGKLADAGVSGVENLYATVSRWNSHPDPLVQIHLAQFYGKINQPRSFGPVFSTLVYHAVNQYPFQASPTYNVSEAVGETVLRKIAERTADETVKRLLPYMQAPQVPPTHR